jgi:hypothetical protein
VLDLPEGLQHCDPLFGHGLQVQDGTLEIEDLFKSDLCGLLVEPARRFSHPLA